MVAKLTRGFWPTVARLILRNRILILLGVAAFTVFLAMQWKNMQFSNTEANILPDDHPATIQYNAFKSIFGEEGNAIVLAIRDSALFTPSNFNRWNKLSKQLDAFPEIDYVISTDNLKVLKKDNEQQVFVMEPLIQEAPQTEEEINAIRTHLFKELPFYDNLIYNAESETIQ
ncbi:MAG: RND family transporter, partial [Allomuricauda sp.]